jgi:exo-beta-1,3-glucanase (GH17 family)
VFFFIFGMRMKWYEGEGISYSPHQGEIERDGHMTLKKTFILFAAVLALISPVRAAEIMSLSYSPSGILAEAQLERGIPEAAIRADLQRLKAFTGHVRTYTVDRGLDKVPAIARGLKIKVSLGLWLGRDRAKNEIEIAKGIRVLKNNSDVIDRVYVGNEGLLRDDISAVELAIYIKRVREAIVGTGIQISTAEPWSQWLKHPEIAAACDFIGVHLLAYWDGVPIAQSIDYISLRYDEVKAAYPGKPIVIAETGWPTDGPKNQAAVPAPASQEIYVQRFLLRAKEKNYDYNIIEAYDQPWKGSAEGHEGAVGAFWGIIDNSGKAKFSFSMR